MGWHYEAGEEGRCQEMKSLVKSIINVDLILAVKGDF